MLRTKWVSLKKAENITLKFEKEVFVKKADIRKFILGLLDHYDIGWIWK